MFLRAVVFSAVLFSTAYAASESPVYYFKQLVVADSEAAVLAVKVDPADPNPIHVKDVPVLEDPGFRAVIDPFIGKQMTPALVNEVSTAIGNFARAHDRLITNVVIPNQNVSDGTLRLAVVVGRFNQVAFSGNKWFSSKLLEERLGIKPGDEVRLSVLEEAVNWANTNPFRRLKVIVNPVNDQPGKADLIVGVQERMPWRFAASVDNYGNEILGKRHYTASVQFGNLLGLDHQGSYQFVTTDDPKTYQVHAFNYRIPTDRRHFIDFSGSYARVEPSFGVANVFTQKGVNKSANLRYILPVRRGDNPIEVWAGLDFKRGNNNLEYAGNRVYASEADTIQLSTGVTYVRRDTRGGWVFGATVNLSPGGITGGNDEETYQNARFGSSPRYIYGTFSIQRQLNLAKGWEVSSRLISQVASTNLIGSEQLTIGGPTTVRGYGTNVFAGDQGFLFSTDVATPNIETSLKKIGKNMPPLTTRFAIFYDAGQVFYKHKFGFDPDMGPLASAGAGVRMTVSNNFSLNFDYGWQITHLPYRSGRGGYGHIKVALAF